MFSKKEKAKFISLLIYVDDVLFVGDYLDLINDTKRLLHQTLRIKDLDAAK